MQITSLSYSLKDFGSDWRWDIGQLGRSSFLCSRLGRSTSFAMFDDCHGFGGSWDREVAMRSELLIFLDLICPELREPMRFLATAVCNCGCEGAPVLGGHHVVDYRVYCWAGRRKFSQMLIRSSATSRCWEIDLSPEVLLLIKSR